MIKRALCLVLSVSACWQASAQGLLTTCTMITGDGMFKGAERVSVERNGQSVIVRSTAHPAKDFWTYKIVFARPELGWFRAIRASESGDHFDVVLGGELVYLLDKGQARIEVTSLNAAASEFYTATMRCD